jgi:hypothetical protein
MSEKIPRKRIGDKMAGAIAVKDDKAYTESLGSKNAREIKTVSEHISLELWFDKHYAVRDQHGSDDGTKRDISSEAVEALVIKALKHLIFYSSTVKGYTFLNHEDHPGTIRAFVKDTIGAKPLSIVIQAHFKNFSKYQVTVITAIDDHIRLGSGQQIIEFVGESHSILKKNEGGKEIPILECQD